MKEKAIAVGKSLCDTMMRKYDAPELPPKQTFLYHQGVFLSGMLNVYKICNEEKYFEYAKKWVDSIIDKDGNILEYDYNNTEVIQPGIDKRSIDHIQPGILLYRLYEKTGDERYKIALKTLMNILKDWPKNKAGGFWHKECHPYQMWLDSLYMGGPIRAEYAAFIGESFWLDEALEQIFIMYENMYDKKSGLMLHAWDESKEAVWADDETGLSEEVWGRALGWYVYAITDILSFTPADHPKRAGVVEIEKKLLGNLMKYRDSDTKMWYQVVDKGECEGNWIETSCSCLFTAAFAKAVSLGVLDKNLTEYVNESFESIVSRLGGNCDNLSVDGVCIGTSVCNYQGYIERPTCSNDLHGVGAFLLMCAAVATSNGGIKYGA